MTPSAAHNTGIETLIAVQLGLASTSWSIGMPGAIAEFFRDEDEPWQTDGATCAVTPRGALRIVADAAIRTVPYKTAHCAGVALSLPEAVCGMHGRGTITEIGPDRDALRKCDRDGILFDLGLGSPYFDFYIRTGEPELIRRLRAGAGAPLFDPAHALPGLIAAASPHRVFASKLGRIEVYQPIAAAGGTTPQGPHTHLLPALLKAGRAHDADAPVPPGWIACAHLYFAGRTHDAGDAH